MSDSLLDRSVASHVCNRVMRPKSAILLGVLLGLTLGVGACGGKGKKAKTTPDTTTDNKDPNGVEGKDPDTSGVKDPPTDPDTDPDKDPASTDGKTDKDPVTKAPEIAPPMLDLDPAEAKTRTTKHLTAARSALQGSDGNRAISEAKAALAVDPTNVDAVVMMAHGYFQRGLEETAQRILDMLYNDKTNPKRQQEAQNHAGLYYVYGLVYDRTGDKVRARLAYEEGKKRNASHGGILINLGAHYVREKRYSEAQALYEKVVNDLGVKTAITYTGLGAAYRGRTASKSIAPAQRAEFIKKAREMFGKALAADAKYANAHYNMGLLYFDANPFPEAGKNMDELKRLSEAKKHFETYKKTPGSDAKLADERIRRLALLITREQRKRQKKDDDDDDW